jgi:hypothetical protein
MTTCQSPLLVSLPVSLLAKSQELPVSQLGRHDDLCHMVITDNQKPETLSLPYGLAPPIKPITHFSQATALWTWKEWQPCHLVPNKSFFSTRGVVFIQLFLTSGAETRERLKGCFSLGLLPWPSCPALSWTKTTELIPLAYGLWISELTALPAFPSILSLSSTALYLIYSSS